MSNSATTWLPDQVSHERFPQNPLEAAEAARLAAMEQGYNDGLDAARRDIEMATEEANKRVRRALSALSEAVIGFDERQTVALADVEDAIVAASFSLARSVLQREIATAVDPGADAIARALAITPGREPALVRLNPDDAATLSITEVPTMGRQIDVLADPAVEAGGCIVEVGSGTIDAQISSALAKVAAALAIPDSMRAGSAVAPNEQGAFMAAMQPQMQPAGQASQEVVAGSNPTNSGTTASEPPVS